MLAHYTGFTLTEIENMEINEIAAWLKSLGELINQGYIQPQANCPFARTK